MEILRAETLPLRAGAYYVRIQGMAVQHHIPPAREFDEHDTPDTRYIVALDDVLPVATCRLYPVDGARMMLGRLVVLPEYRGRGLGSAVLAAAEDWARALGFDAAVLEARVEKVGFYEKRGYLADRSTVIHGETFTCIPMEKPLRKDGTQLAVPGR